MTDNQELEQEAIDVEVVDSERDDTETSSGSAGKLALLLSLVAIICIAVVAWFGWTAWQSVQQLSQQNADLAKAVEAQSETMVGVSARTQRIDELLDGQQQVVGKVEQLESSVERGVSNAGRLESALGSLDEQLGALRKDSNEIAAKLGSNSRRAWLEAEVEFLLRIANQVLQFKADNASAIRALQAADERLVGLDDPGFYKVREAIADEIHAISNAPKADVVGMALSLAGAIDGVAKLPLYNETPDQFKRAEEKALSEHTEPAERNFKSLASDMWQQLKQLVVVRRDDAPYQPLLTADQTTNLYSNLELKLEAARVALLRGDKVLFDQSLDMADQWLESWFDTESNAVSTLRQRIETLKAQPMVSETPDISTSLKHLVDVMESRDRAAGDR